MYFLTLQSLSRSAVALRNQIEGMSGVRLDITYGARIKPHTIIAVRWANSTYYPADVTDKRLNDWQFIRNMGNKLNFSRMFGKDIWTPSFNSGEPADSDFPVLIRTTLVASGGKGIIPCRNRKEFNTYWSPSYYWTPYVNMSSEFRVHVFNGKVLRIFRKVISPQVIEEKDFHIRNSSRGWSFELTGSNGDSLTKLKETAVNVWNLAVKKFKIEHGFFALDCGWSPEKKQYFVLEANSGPGMADNLHTRMLYAREIVNTLHL